MLEVHGRGGFSCYYLSEDRQRQHRAYLAEEIRKLCERSDALFTEPIEDWERFYEMAHEWRSKTVAFLRESCGSTVVDEKFWHDSKLQPYPHSVPEPHKSSVDEFYAQALNLKEILAEYSADQDLRLRSGIRGLLPRWRSRS